MKSIFAARQRYLAGSMSKTEFNIIVLKWAFGKWVPIGVGTEPHWRWLCELACYFELKHYGVE